MIAIKNNRLHLTRYMLAACKADPNAIGILGSTPLHHAATAGNKDVVALLLNYGAEPTVANVYGETPLHFASRQGNGDVVETLILYGAHVGVSTTKGKYTPLMFAAGAGMTDAIKHLMDHGADPNARNQHWQTAVLRAAGAGHEDAVSAIVNWTPGEGHHNKKKKVRVYKEPTVGEGQGAKPRSDEAL